MINLKAFDPTDANAAMKAAELANKYEKTLQQVMQVLGPDGVPKDVDYTVPGNLAGLEYEYDEAVRIIRAAGIEYKR